MQDSHKKLQFSDRKLTARNFLEKLISLELNAELGKSVCQNKYCILVFSNYCKKKQYQNYND